MTSPTMQDAAAEGRVWQPIATAPKDGTWFWGMKGILAQRTQWGKTSHVPLYGWCFVSDEGDGDPEYDLWEPTHWQPLNAGEANP